MFTKQIVETVLSSALQELVSATRVARGEPREKKAWQQFALAVRNVVALKLTEERPRLLQQATTGYLEVYGGSCVRVQKNGKLKVSLSTTAGKLRDVSFSVARLGEWLYTQGETAIHRAYADYVAARVTELAAAAGLRLGHDCVPDAATMVDWSLHAIKMQWWGKTDRKKISVAFLSKQLWTVVGLDREVFGLMRRVYGFSGESKDYNACMERRSELMDRCREAPNMLPMLGFFPSQGKWYVGVELAAHPTVLQDCREVFLKSGGTAAGWRWLANQGATTVAMLLRNMQFGSTFLAEMASAMAAAQVGKVPACDRFWHRHVGAYNLPKFAKLIKEATVAVRRRQLKVKTLREQFVLVADFVASPEVTMASLKGATWASLFRRQVEWHRAYAREELERLKASGVQYFWLPVVQEVASKGLRAVSLNESAELWEEGLEMGHCVGGYAPRCYHNTSRIFSIRDVEGVRIATLEASRVGGGRWKLAQLYGAGNKSITDTAVRRLAGRVIGACNRAPEPLISANRRVEAPEHARIDVADAWSNDVPFDDLPFEQVMVA